MITYYLAMAFGLLMSRLPFRVLYVFSDVIFVVLKYILHYRKSVIMQNLSIAFPERSIEAHHQIRSDFYRNFADIIVESFKSLHLSEDTARQRFRLTNPEVFEQLYAQNKGVIMVMGHYANFEWTAMNIPLWVPHPCFAVYHPLKNQRFSQTIVRIREQFGLQLFKMKETYPFMLNNPAHAPLYVFMADQSPHRGKIKYRAPFFNRNTPVHLGVENLSKKCDLAVVFVETQRVKRGYYELTAQLLFENPQQTKEHEITHRHMEVLESIIRKHPADWLWSHNRWKHAEPLS